MSILDLKLLRPIKKPEKVKKIDESLSWVIRYQLKQNWAVEVTLFKLAQWVAVPVVPVMDEILFSPMARERLQQITIARGNQQLWVVPMDTRSLPAYEMPVMIEAIEEFERCLGSFCCAVFTGELEPEWVLVSIESELYVVAGPVDFVRQLLKCEIEEAFSSFHERVMNEPMLPQLKKYLDSVYDRLKGHYQSAEVGAEFLLTP